VVDRASEFEARLAQLWKRNLGVPSSSDNDYFQQGGDSLRGAQLLSWIHTGFGVELSLLDLFGHRTIEAQARLLMGRLDAARPKADRPMTDYRFFGPTDACLFSALHRPADTAAKAGVVLCYPMGQEYMRIHRTYVELARSLAVSGLYAMRFDYFGCGDSAGKDISGNLEQWREDIRRAVRELRNRTAAQDVLLVGSRIGANLVLDVTAAGLDEAGVVVWEPVVNGPDYIAALRRAHRDLLANNAKLDGYEERQPVDCFMELLGFPVSEKLYEELSAIDLLASPVTKAMPDTLVLANSNKPGLEAFVAARGNGQARLDYVVADESDHIWLKEDRQNKGLVPARAVEAIVAWISGRTK
jgi:alpha/beta superfamily hydrolase